MTADIQERAKFVKTLPDAYIGVFTRAYEGKSLRNAINAKCLDCTACQRNQIKDCEITTCPLWSVRPYQAGSQNAVEPDNSPVKAEIILEQKKLVLL